jgi:hypothetical protein
MRYLGKYNGDMPGPAPRTYRDLLTMGRASYGSCVSCHKSVYGDRRATDRATDRAMFSLGTRANICRECCENKGDEVLGYIVRAERRARWYVRDAIKRKEDVTRQLRFYAHLTGAPEEFIAAEYRKELAR